ncbi:MAG: hypothetical protein ABSC37_18870 [Xanthobacteraceae bacterium]|jgi:hypothetical protein
MTQHIHKITAVEATTRYAPGYLLAPFGWAADAVGAMVEAEPTLLFHLFELDRARMHLIALALAHLNDFSPDIAFIGKQLAIVGDMRLGSKCDKDLLAENILKLSGRGLFTIDRKHKDHLTGSLPCKLLLISNEMPKFKDTSGALASRPIIFQTRISFYGELSRKSSCGQSLGTRSRKSARGARRACWRLSRSSASFGR